MNSPTCNQCDCVAGCQANIKCCPNLEKPLNWRQGPCQGVCDEHSGNVHLVEVDGWGQFRYCEAAIEEDRARNFTVSIVEQQPEIAK